MTRRTSAQNHSRLLSHYCLFSYLGIQGNQFHKCYRCYLHYMFIHLRTSIGIVCIWFAHKAQDQRPHGAIYSINKFPFICFAIDTITQHTTGYKFGYELLMVNGALTFAGMFIFRISLRYSCASRASASTSSCSGYRRFK